jgi:hypothetical protein
MRRLEFHLSIRGVFVTSDLADSGGCARQEDERYDEGGD